MRSIVSVKLSLLRAAELSSANVSKEKLNERMSRAHGLDRSLAGCIGTRFGMNRNQRRFTRPRKQWGELQSGSWNSLAPKPLSPGDISKL